MSQDNSKTNSSKPTEKEDAELADLLNSALEDFKETPKKTEKKNESGESSKNESNKSKKQEEEEEIVAEEWNQEFIKEAMAEFQTKLGGLLNEQNSEDAQEKLQETFSQIADTAQQLFSGPLQPSESSDTFATSISRTLRDLNSSTTALHERMASLENSLAGLLSGDGAVGGPPSGENLVPFMQGMMQSLLSKDVLYPSLKDILERYPGWIEENEGKVAPEEMNRYKKQQALMQEVCSVLETEKEDDSSEIKFQRFEKVLDLMQKLQDYGQPPTELVGDVGPTLPEMGNMTDPNQCSIM